MAGFSDQVVEIVAGTRPGEVLAYGEVAAEAGNAAAARAVGRVLRARGADLPWWRIVTAGGRLVPGLEVEQAARLAAEGVTCRDGRVSPTPCDDDGTATKRCPPDVR